jgi:hypothetical protein
MLEFSPFFTFLAILALVAAFAARVAWRRRVFAGYSEFHDELQRVARILKGDIARDGDDLLIQGNYGKVPVMARFSHADNAPELSIRTGAPASFAMCVLTRSASAFKKGRTQIGSRNRVFDSRFSIWSDHPAEARLFLSMKGALEQMQRICNSPHSFLNITPGTVEASELIVPGKITEYVLAQLGYLRVLSATLLTMPGADNIKVLPYRQPGSRLARYAVVVGLLTALVATLVLYNSPSQILESHSVSPSGISAADARLIANLDSWRIVREADYDQDAISWLRFENIEPAGRITGDFSGTNAGRDRDVAYILKNENDGLMRVVILSEGKSIYDLRYHSITTAVRVPNSNLGSILWQTSPTGVIDGDGLLIATKADDRSSGMILGFHDQKLVIGVPVDYQKVGLF